MTKTYRMIDDVLRSLWAELPLKPAQKSESPDRVFRSTKLENSIYADVRMEDEELEHTEQITAKKLHSFLALSRDICQAVYSLTPRWHEEAELSAAARKFSSPILDQVLQNEDCATLKSIGEGHELPAY